MRYVNGLRALFAFVCEANPDQLTRGGYNFSCSQVLLTRKNTSKILDTPLNGTKLFQFFSTEIQKSLTFQGWAGKSKALAVFETFFKEDERTQANADGSASK